MMSSTEKNRAGEPELVGAGCFWLLGAGSGAGAGKRNFCQTEPIVRSRSRFLALAAGAGFIAARKKKYQELEPELKLENQERGDQNFLLKNKR